MRLIDASIVQAHQHSAGAKKGGHPTKSDTVAAVSYTHLELAQQNYETALRYINIAEHMNKFEDQDKYYHRAIQYLKKAKPYKMCIRDSLFIGHIYFITFNT